MKTDELLINLISHYFLAGSSQNSFKTSTLPSLLYELNVLPNRMNRKKILLSGDDNT